MCFQNLYMSVPYSVHKWTLLEYILVVNVNILWIDKVKACYWKLNKDTTILVYIFIRTPIVTLIIWNLKMFDTQKLYLKT